jgi:hypothetical protein
MMTPSLPVASVEAREFADLVEAFPHGFVVTRATRMEEAHTELTKTKKKLKRAQADFPWAMGLADRITGDAEWPLIDRPCVCEDGALAYVPRKFVWEI